MDPGDHPRTTAWNTLKRDSGSPTLTHLKALIAHHEWLAAQRFAAIEAVVASRHVEVLGQCEAHAAHAGRNYSPFLWRFYAPYRPTLFTI